MAAAARLLHGCALKDLGQLLVCCGTKTVAAMATMPQVAWMFDDYTFGMLAWWGARSAFLDLPGLKASFDDEIACNNLRAIRMWLRRPDAGQDREIGPVNLEAAWKTVLLEVLEDCAASVTVHNALKLSQHELFKFKLCGRFRGQTSFYLVEDAGRPEVLEKGQLERKVQEKVSAVVREHPVSQHDKYKIQLTDVAAELYGQLREAEASVLAIQPETKIWIVQMTDGEQERCVLCESEAGPPPLSFLCLRSHRRALCISSALLLQGSFG